MLCTLVHFVNFNPRSREGSDQCNDYAFALEEDFNPRSREGSDVCGKVKQRITSAFQSTLPRRERQQAGRGDGYRQTISIHAPAKGATIGSWGQTEVKNISIHAPAKGATSRRFGSKT